MFESLTVVGVNVTSISEGSWDGASCHHCRIVYRGAAKAFL
jgi:hypothetical protein